MAEDWLSKAYYLGYETERDMLYDMYVMQELSTVNIARKLCVGQPTIIRRLRLARIPRRKRGGAYMTQKEWTRLHLMDQRIVFFTPLGQLADRLQVSDSCVYKYRRGVRNGLRPNSTDQRVEQVSEPTQS